MVRFLRRLRQQLFVDNRFSKYLIYGIGEIVLIIIGILIALQINNWNEEQNQIKELRSQYSSLILDLESDIDMLKIRQGMAENNYLFSDSLLNYIRCKSIAEMSNLDLYLLHPKTSYRPLEWNTTSIDEMKFSGSIQHIKDHELISLLFQYEANKIRLDKQESIDNSKLMTTYDFWNEILDRNYTIPWNAIVLLNRDSNGNKVIRQLSTDSLYLLMQKENLKLLTNDINKVKKGGNFARDFMNGLRFRFERDFPETIQAAEELIVILKRELEVL